MAKRRSVSTGTDCFDLLAELTIDLHPYLPRWPLLADEPTRETATAMIIEQKAANRFLCKNWNKKVGLYIEKVAH